MITLAGTVGAADNVTQSFLAQTYPALAGAVATPVYLAAVLYWALYGYRIYAGHAPMAWRDLLAKGVMTVGVFACLNWGGVATTLYNAFVSFMESAAGTIMAGQSTPTMLDALFKNVASVADTLQNLSWMHLAIIIQGVALFVLNCALLVIALAYMTIAKIGLAITMVLLPLFLGFFFFEPTRHWGMNWLNKMLTFSLLYVIVIAIVRFGFLAFSDTINNVGQMAASTVSEGATELALASAQTVQLFVIEGVLILFMLSARGWAAALASGAASSTGVLMMAMRSAMVHRRGK